MHVCELMYLCIYVFVFVFMLLWFYGNVSLWKCVIMEMCYNGNRLGITNNTQAITFRVCSP